MLKRLMQSLAISALVVSGAMALSTFAAAQTGRSGSTPETGTGGAADAGRMHRGHMDGGMGHHMDGGHHGRGHMDGGMHKGM
jgi:hypothetical protein